MKEELFWDRMICRIPFNHTAKQGMLQRDFAYGFCLWETVTNLLASIFSFLIITFRLKPDVRKTSTHPAGVSKHCHLEPLIFVAGSSFISCSRQSRSWAHSAQGRCKWDTARRSLSLSINYRGSPRKLYPQLNLVIVNPLPTFEYTSYQADLAAGND